MICMFSFLIVVSVHCQTCVIEPIKVECNFNFTYQTFALKVHSHNHLLSNNNKKKTKKNKKKTNNKNTNKTNNKKTNKKKNNNKNNNNREQVIVGVQL